MTYNRVFSDTEIVTIAAVAAAALGGIVVGLGRGQANEATPVTATDKLREISSAGFVRAQESVPDRSELGSWLHDLPNRAPALPDPRAVDVSPLKETFGALADTLKKPEINATLPSWLRKILPSDVSVSSLRDSAKSAAHSTEERVPSRDQLSDVAGQIGALTGVTALLRRAASHQESGGSDESRLTGASAAVRGVVSDAVEQIGAHLPSSDMPSDARERAGDAVQRHVTDPVSRAASSTKDVTMETLTAALWLSAGAGLVYFGLLSAERREQVKGVLCGAFEQARLLAMDFQGYESEM